MVQFHGSVTMESIDIDNQKNERKQSKEGKQKRSTQEEMRKPCLYIV